MSRRVLGFSLNYTSDPDIWIQKVMIKHCPGSPPQPRFHQYLLDSTQFGLFVPPVHMGLL